VKIDAIGFIPARYASTRLPGKPLINICGKPMLQWVWEAVSKCNNLRRVVIATDDNRIADFCYDIGAEFVFTPKNLESGTDRIIYAYNLLQEFSNIIVNIQGDEPLITSDDIDNLITEISQTNYDVGTLFKRINSADELLDPSVVKIALNNNNTAMDFLRNIPGANKNNITDFLNSNLFVKHIGIYAYFLPALQRFAILEPSQHEKELKLEQFRLMDDGATYYCVETNKELIGVDTIEDVKRVSELINRGK
jgi:3-deoxy-manno-octulosonate cytidylyltransferase (CMP-KDO synthetase)